MGLFKDNFKEYKKAEDPLFITPKSIQETLEIKKVAKNGIFEVSDGKYSKCYRFDDVNYVTESESGQINILDSYGKILTSLDTSMKVIVINKPTDMQELRTTNLCKMKGDQFDVYRKAMNKHIEQKIEDGLQGVEQQKYLLTTVNAKTYEESKNLFAAHEITLEEGFMQLNSKIYPLNADERLTSIRNIYRIKDKNTEPIVLDDYISNARDWKSDIVNTKVTKYNDLDFQLDDMFCRTLFISGYPKTISDRFFHQLTSVPCYSVTSVDIVPIPKEVGLEKIRNVAMGIENTIINQQRRRNNNQDFSSDISYKIRQEKTEVENEMYDIMNNDQKYFYVGINITVMAETKEELNSITRTLKTLCQGEGCKLVEQYKQQRRAFNTCLPIGVRQVSNMRTMLTRSVTGILPFHVQELQYTSPNTYYGVNQVSKKLILGDRSRLDNGNGFCFGNSGSGKSYQIKMEIASNFLNKDNADIIIIDPQNEYVDMASIFYGSFINLSNNADKYINPLEVNLEELDILDRNGIIQGKIEFMLGLCEQAIGSHNIELGFDSVISRCVRTMYETIAALPKEKRYQAKLEDFYEILQQQEEEEARRVALGLEVFVSGGLNLFNHDTNINVNNRFVVYGMRELGKKMSPMAMLTMMESIKNKVYENYAKGKETHIYVDEIHVMMEDDFSAGYLAMLWKTLRKFGGYMTGITQNVIDVTKNSISETMISNSEFVLLLKQNPRDMELIQKSIDGVTKEQLKYVSNSAKGTGLIKHGNVIIPFDARMDKDNILYWVFNTDPHESEERKRRLQQIM